MKNGWDGRMHIVRHQFWKEKIVLWLPVIGQLIVLIVVAVMLLWPAPFTSNQLFASWPGSDLDHSHWTFALLIQRTLMQTHHLPFWNPYRSPSAWSDATLLGWMNVNIVVSRRHLTDPHFVQVGVVDGTLIYKNTADAGPSYLIEPGANNDPPALNDMKRLDAQVRVTTFVPEQKTFTFFSPTSAYFVIATPMFPGWTARLDGHAVPVQLIGNVMPAIKVGMGTHTLSYTYTPSYVLLGAVLSVVGILATIIWLLAGYYIRPGRRFLFDDVKKPNGKQYVKV